MAGEADDTAPDQPLVPTLPPAFAAAFPPRPWLTIFIRPHATIRAIVDSDPERHVVLIACLGGVLSALERASDRALGDRVELPWILLVAAILGPVFGFLWLHIFGGLVRWTGAWLGGWATGEHVRAAIAWPTVALVPAALFFAAEIALFGKEVFISQEPSPAFSLVALGHVIVALPMAVWWVVLLAKCVGEVQQFSAWRGLANLFIASLILFSPFVLIGLAMYFGTG